MLQPRSDTSHELEGVTWPRVAERGWGMWGNMWTIARELLPLFSWSLGKKTDWLGGLKMDPEEICKGERELLRACNMIRSKVIDECGKWTVRGFLLALKIIIVKLLVVLTKWALHRLSHLIFTTTFGGRYNYSSTNQETESCEATGPTPQVSHIGVCNHWSQVPEPLNFTTALKSWPGSPSNLEEIWGPLVRLEDSFCKKQSKVRGLVLASQMTSEGLMRNTGFPGPELEPNNNQGPLWNRLWYMAAKQHPAWSLQKNCHVASVIFWIHRKSQNFKNTNTSMKMNFISYFYIPHLKES